MTLLVPKLEGLQQSEQTVEKTTRELGDKNENAKNTSFGYV